MNTDLSNSTSPEQVLREHRRRAIIDFLGGPLSSESNEAVISDCLDLIGIRSTRGQIRDEFEFCQNFHLITTRIYNGTMVAKLTRQGHECYEGRKCYEGIARRQPDH